MFKEDPEAARKRQQDEDIHAIRANGERVPGTALDEWYCEVRERAVAVATTAHYVATWPEIGRATFDACDRMVGLMRDIGSANHLHLTGYSPPADLTICDKALDAIELLHDGDFRGNVPALLESRRIILNAVLAIGATVCTRMLAHGERPSTVAMQMFRPGARRQYA
jgi:hypothetical protein